MTPAKTNSNNTKKLRHGKNGVKDDMAKMVVQVSTTTTTGKPGWRYDWKSR